MSNETIIAETEEQAIAELKGAISKSVTIKFYHEGRIEIDWVSIEQAARNLFKRAKQETALEIYEVIYENGIKNSMSLQQLMETFEKEFKVKKKHDFSKSI